MRKSGKWIIATFFAVVASAILVLAARFNRGSSEPGVRGIDVSHHQGPIDWRKVRAQGIAFAYIKATEGGDWTDRLYASNLQGARASGVLAGSYHFFTFCKPGDVQARNFLRHADLSGGDLLPVVDVETVGNCADGAASEFDPGRLHQEVKAFLDIVEERIGRRPIIYTTHWFHWKHMGPEFDGERFWIRNLFWKPSRSIDWVFWQYSVDDLEGVNGEVDKNEFAGGSAGLGKWVMK